MSVSATASGGAKLDLFPLRPTSLLRARARVVGSPATKSELTPTAIAAPGRGYFKSLSTRKTYTIAELLAVRTKFVLCPNLPELSCVEAGADDSVSWGLRSTGPSTTPTNFDMKRSKLKLNITKSMEAINEQPNSLDANVAPLPLSVNRWRPQASSGFPSTIKKLKGILNKLTVDKFDMLSIQFVNMVLANCPTLNELREAVQLVFDKALDEMNFGDLYPNLVVLLSEKLPAIPADHDEQQHKKVTFRSVMLSMCQSEFEKAYLAVLPAATPVQGDPQVELLRMKQRRRLLGNMKFIGELYNKKLLNMGVIIYCTRQLTSGIRADHIEAVCTLLEVVGAALDAEAKGKDAPMAQVRELFNRLNAIGNMSPVGIEQVDSRTRFLVREIVELRSSGWVPRRKKQEAMTIDEFRAKEEPVRHAVRNLLTDAPVMMTPSGTMTAFGRVRSGGNTSTPSSSSGRTPRHADRYSRPQHEPSSSPIMSDQDLAKRYDRRQRATPVSTSEGSGLPLANGSFPGNAAAKVVTPAVKTLSVDEINRGVDSMVREFLSIADIQEAMLCITELSQDDNSLMHSCIACSAASQALEAHDATERTNAASLIAQLYKRQTLSAQDIENGLLEVLTILPDIVIDLPIAPERLADFLRSLIKDGCLPASFVASTSPNSLTEKVFAKVRA